MQVSLFINNYLFYSVYLYFGPRLGQDFFGTKYAEGSWKQIFGYS